MLAAISAYKTIENDILKCDNYLLISDLSSPPSESQHHFDYIKKLSKQLLNWRKIIYIHDFDNDHDLLNNEILNINFKNILLSQNFNELNELIIKVFSKSNVLCYGDALGLNFSLKYYFPNKIFNIQSKYTKHILSLINLFDQKIDNFIKVKSKDLLSVINNASGINDSITSIFYNNINELINKYEKVIFILTANYSETGRMQLENEINCYANCLSEYSLEDCLIIIKPHPRDSIKKHQFFKKLLLNSSNNVIILSDYFKYIPFEVIYYILLTKYNLTTHDHKIFSSSSSILFIEYLFKKKCVFMFGIDIVLKYFNKDWIQLRIQHEKDIINAISLIRSNKII